MRCVYLFVQMNIGRFAIDNSNVILSMSSFFRIARALGIEFTPTFIL